MTQPIKMHSTTPPTTHNNTYTFNTQWMVGSTARPLAIVCKTIGNNFNVQSARHACIFADRPPGLIWHCEPLRGADESGLSRRIVKPHRPRLDGHFFGGSATRRALDISFNAVGAVVAPALSKEESRALAKAKAAKQKRHREIHT